MNTESDIHDEGDASMGCIGGSRPIPNPIQKFPDLQRAIEQIDFQSYIEEDFFGYRIVSPSLKAYDLSKDQRIIELLSANNLEQRDAPAINVVYLKIKK